MDQVHPGLERASCQSERCLQIGGSGASCHRTTALDCVGNASGEREEGNRVGQGECYQERSFFIEEVNRMTIEVADFGLLEGPVTPGQKEQFSSEYGKVLSTAYTTIVSPAAKLLKGSDRELLTELSNTVEKAVMISVEAFLVFDFVPFLDQMRDALSSTSPDKMPLVLLPEDGSSCFQQIQGTFNKTRLKSLVEAAVACAGVAKSFQQALMDKLDAKETKSALEAWKKVTITLNTFLKNEDKDDIQGLLDSISGVTQAAQETL